MPTGRNPVIRHGMILRKGGVHTTSVSGERHRSRRQLDDEIDEYFEDKAFSDNRSNQRGKKSIGNTKGADKSAPFLLAPNTLWQSFNWFHGFRRMFLPRKLPGTWG